MGFYTNLAVGISIIAAARCWWLIRSGGGLLKMIREDKDRPIRFTFRSAYGETEKFEFAGGILCYGLSFLGLRIAWERWNAGDEFVTVLVSLFAGLAVVWVVISYVGIIVDPALKQAQSEAKSN